MVIGGGASATLKSMSAASTKPTTGIAAPVCVLSLGLAIVEGLRFVAAVRGVHDDLLSGCGGLRVTLGLGLGLTTRLISTLGVGLGFVLVFALTSVLARFGAPSLDSALPSLLSEVAAMAAAPSALSAPNVAPASAASASVVSATALSTVVSSLATETGETGSVFSKGVRRFASSSSSLLKKSTASLSTLSRSTRSASLSTSVDFAAHLEKSSASLSTLSRSTRSASLSTSFGFAAHLDSATSSAMTLAAVLPPSDVERRKRSNNAIRGGATRYTDR